MTQDDTGNHKVIRDFEVLEAILAAPHQVSRGGLTKKFKWSSSWARNVQLARLVKLGLIKKKWMGTGDAHYAVACRHRAEEWLREVKGRRPPERESRGIGDVEYSQDNKPTSKAALLFLVKNHPEEYEIEDIMELKEWYSKRMVASQLKKLYQENLIHKDPETKKISLAVTVETARAWAEQ